MSQQYQQALLASAKIIEETLDEKLNEMEEMTDEDYLKLRQKRLQSLKNKSKMKQEWVLKGHGKVVDINDATFFFNEVKNNKLVVVLFTRPGNQFAEIVLSHLNKLAPKHLETHFLKVEAEANPILVEHLKIWMIPTIVCIKDGRTDHSIVGLDELGGANFTTVKLEKLLIKCGVMDNLEEEEEN
ncbi:hypothetical protein ABK040_006322 [Willaertia magna]